MRRNCLIRRVTAVFLALIYVIMGLPLTTAMAAEPEQCSLTIKYIDEGKAIPGVAFRIYRAADLTENGGYSLTQDFAGCPVTLRSQMTNEDWVKAAQALFDYVKENSIKPDRSGRTSEDGTLVFEGLEAGLYLIEGDSYDYRTTVYTPQVFCVVLPERDDTGNPVYNVTVYPKYSKVDNPPPPEDNHGHLTVTKTVTGNAGDTNKEWRFHVELSDKSINGWYGSMFFTNGVTEFTLKHGQSATALNLPEGITYTVTEQEANLDGYTTSSTGETGTIPDGGTAEAEFVNHKDKNPPDNPPDTPQTGDNSHLGMWSFLMVISILGMIACIFSMFKGHRQISDEEDRRD